MKKNFSLPLLITATVLLVSGCTYKFPLTDKPTHKVDIRLLGDWVAVDKDTKKEEVMHVRQWDDFTYAVAMDNDIYRVSHSDFAGVAFVSAQDLNSDDRKFSYFRWSLSADEKQLSLTAVNEKTIPEATKNAATVRQLIKQNLTNPALYRDEMLFTRK